MSYASNGFPEAGFPEAGLSNGSLQYDPERQRSIQEMAYKQQLTAMKHASASRERDLRLEVLRIAADGRTGDVVGAAERYWAFVTSGDPKEAEDPNA